MHIEGFNLYIYYLGWLFFWYLVAKVLIYIFLGE